MNAEWDAKIATGSEPQRMPAGLSLDGVPLQLRAMVHADVAQVLAIEVQSQIEPWAQQAFVAELESSPVSQPLVAARREEIVGFIMPWWVADELQIANIAVKESCRRRGIARWMLQAVLEQARRRHCRMVYLEVRRSNLAALRLYEELGFEVEGLRRNYYGRAGEDAILMKKVPG